MRDKADFIILHGSFGNPFENWIPWLYKALCDQGYSVLVPHFPSGTAQNYDNWKAIFNEYGDYVDHQTTIIAHSLGPAFAANWVIENKSIQAKHFIAVAPFYGLIDIKEFDDVNKSFFLEGQNLPEARAHFGNISCLYSDNDPYVPMEMSSDFAQQLDATTHIIPNGGHLNEGAGFTEFPLLLDLALS